MTEKQQAQIQKYNAQISKLESEINILKIHRDDISRKIEFKAQKIKELELLTANLTQE